MKVLLYDTGDVRGELNEPIGIELLGANMLKDLEEQVSLDMKWFNFDGYSFDPLQYDVIGISIHINGLNVFENIYRLLRGSGFKGLIIAGNSIATFAYKQLLDKYPNIVCVIGEGEYAFREIIRGYMKGYLNLLGIPNLAYLDQGNLITTKRTVCNMEEYVPPLRAFDEQLLKNKGIVRIEASRGCTWNKCNFCGASHKYNNVGWRPIDIGIVLKQLIELSNAGFTTVYFCDEDFIGNDRKRFAKLVDIIREKKITREISPDMKFFVSIKPADLVSQINIEIIKRFISCGLKELFIGLESGCENQLKRYNKCTNLKINSLAVSRIKELMENDLAIDIGFIFFDYYMTPADIEENIKFIEVNKLYMFASSLIKPIRIQPFTKTFTYTPGVHMNEFSVDDLMFNFRFIDDIVERIYTTYSELKLETIAHEIQSVYRREMSSEAERKMAEKTLTQLRILQFSAIKTIVTCYIHKEIDELQLKDKLDEVRVHAVNLYPNP